MPIQIFITFVFWVALGALTAYLAEKWKRNPLPWFFIGMLFGVFGLLALYLMPQVEEKTSKVEAEPIPDPFSLKMWFYLKEGEQIGPVAFDKLKREWKDSTYVWSEGMAEWKKIGDLPELKSRLEKI